MVTLYRHFPPDTMIYRALQILTIIKPQNDYSLEVHFSYIKNELKKNDASVKGNDTPSSAKISVQRLKL